VPPNAQLPFSSFTTYLEYQLCFLWFVSYIHSSKNDDDTTYLEYQPFFLWFVSYIYSSKNDGDEMCENVNFWKWNFSSKLTVNCVEVDKQIKNRWKHYFWNKPASKCSQNADMHIFSTEVVQIFRSSSNFRHRTPFITHNPSDFYEKVL